MSEKSEYDKIMSNPERKVRFDKAYYRFLLDELGTACYNEDIESIEELTKMIIQIIKEKPTA